MVFNISFSLTALVFLLIIVWRFFSKRQFPLFSNKLFGILLLFAVLDLVLDISGTISLRYIHQIPLSVAYVINALYYITQIGFPSALAIYILALAQNTGPVKKKLYFIFTAPAMAAELLLLCAMPFGLVFRITNEAGYTYGPLFVITYLTAAVYLAITLFLLWQYRRRLTTDESNSMFLLALIILLSTIIQYNNPSLLVTSASISVALTIAFFTIQDPNRMLDSTTQLFNYSAFLLSLCANFSSGKHFSVIAVDLHGLRRVNMLYGMSEGDAMLRRISEFLLSEKRVWVFRISDVRFALLALNKSKYNSLLHRICSRLEYPWPTTSGRQITMTMSVCCIKNAEQLDSTAAVLNTMESLLRDSRNGVCEADEEALLKIEREATIENAMRIDFQSANGFSLVYQPICSTDTNRFSSAETLLRYTHPKLGHISPGEFVPIIENAGLAFALDEMVVRLAFSELETVRSFAPDFDHIQINLSPASFASDSITDTILKLARDHKVDSKFIVFEITETTATFSARMVHDCMRRLTLAGFRFALDDFGTGYANITRVLELPFSIVKLDASLLYGSASVFEDVVRIFDRLELDIVAEGVETETQAQFALSLGLRYIQGFYYARPMPLSDLGDFLIASA